MGGPVYNFKSAKMKFFTILAFFAGFAFAAIGDDCASHGICGASEYCYGDPMFGDTKTCTACPEGIGIITTEALCGDDQVCKDTCSENGHCESSSECGESEYCMENEVFGEVVSKTCEACPEAIGFISVGSLCGDSDECKDRCGSAAGNALSIFIALVLAAFYKF